MDSEKHQRFTGVPNGVILGNARRIAESKNSMIVRIPLIPGFNDTEEEVKRIAEFVLSLGSVERVNLLPYHELGKAKYRMLDRDYVPNDGDGIPDYRISELQALVQSRGLECDID